jgi:hypothetical protein
VIWLGLALAIAYALDVPWRLWRKRPLRFGTLWVELLLPVLFLMQLDRNPLRVLTTAIVCVAALYRVIVRKRLGVPA